jgi:hypothetical protein
MKNSYIRSGCFSLGGSETDPAAPDRPQIAQTPLRGIAHGASVSVSHNLRLLGVRLGERSRMSPEVRTQFHRFS